MGAVGSLCSRIIYLKNGRIAASGPPEEVIAKYLEAERSTHGSDVEIPDDEDRGYTLRAQGRQLTLSCGEPVTLEFEVDCPGEHAVGDGWPCPVQPLRRSDCGRQQQSAGHFGDGQQLAMAVHVRAREYPAERGYLLRLHLVRQQRPRSRQFFSRFLDSCGSGRSVRLGQQSSRILGPLLLEADLDDLQRRRSGHQAPAFRSLAYSSELSGFGALTSRFSARYPPVDESTSSFPAALPGAELIARRARPASSKRRPRNPLVRRIGRALLAVLAFGFGCAAYAIPHASRRSGPPDAESADHRVHRAARA